MKEPILISACLMGIPCRYDGKSKPCEMICDLADRFELIPVCPELLGGLSTPRLPCEIKGDSVIRCDGADCTDAYQAGAEKALEIAKKHHCKIAILKERSPSCGTNFHYDGAFRKRLIHGEGITAALLKKHGITLFSEDEIDQFIKQSPTS